ncbi:hypothetical protein L7F22_030353 [Adiantum nelumboides]|nr:hypothetical protein [Adiantum nelumboides]
MERGGEELSADSVRSAMEASDLNVVMALRTLEAVEKDAQGVASSLSSLLCSIQSALSMVTSSSVEHLECYNDAAGRVQEAVIWMELKCISPSATVFNCCSFVLGLVPGVGATVFPSVKLEAMALFSGSL